MRRRILKLLLYSERYPRALMPVQPTIHSLANRLMGCPLSFRDWDLRLVTEQGKYDRIDTYHLEREYFWIQDFIPKGRWTVIDIGAFIGEYTVLYSLLTGKKAKIISLEPNPIVFKRLMKNVDLYGLSNVTPLNLAVGDSEGDSSFFCKGAGSSMFKKHIKNSIEIKVKVTTVDKLIKKLGLSTVDLLKVDVEGAELAVLRGATQSFGEKIVKRSVIEVHKDLVTVNETAKQLKALGAQVLRVVDLPDRAYVYTRIIS